MAVHSDSNLGAMMALLLVAIVAWLLVFTLVRVSDGQYRQAGRTFLLTAGLVAAYLLVVVVVSLTTPRKVIAIGDSYCYDSWCIGIEKVSATALLYKVDLHLFSDANGVSTSAKGTPVYVLDDYGRHWPLKPFDVTLDAHQSIHTSLTFLALADAKQLFLTGDPAWHLMPSLYVGSDSSLLHKPALLVVKGR